MAGVAIGGPEHGAAERVVSEPATDPPTSHSHPAPQRTPTAHAANALEQAVVTLDPWRPVGAARRGFERDPARFIPRGSPSNSFWPASRTARRHWLPRECHRQRKGWRSMNRDDPGASVSSGPRAFGMMRAWMWHRS